MRDWRARTRPGLYVPGFPGGATLPIVAAVPAVSSAPRFERGLLTLEDACRRYTLTVEEFLAWQRAIERFGMPGLRATRVQQYRH